MWVNAWASVRMDKDRRWWSLDWNFRESVRKQMNLPKQVIIKDSTLKEGEEMPGIYFTINQKIELLKDL